MTGKKHPCETKKFSQEIKKEDKTRTSSELVSRFINWLFNRHSAGQKKENKRKLIARRESTS